MSDIYYQDIPVETLVRFIRANSRNRKILVHARMELETDHNTFYPFDGCVQITRKEAVKLAEDAYGFGHRKERPLTRRVGLSQRCLFL